MHRYTLQPYQGLKSRYHCPQCQHRNTTFVRYIDTQTNQQLAQHVGRCSREDNCGYHYKPADWFKELGNQKLPISRRQQQPVVESLNLPAPATYIHPDIVNASFGNYHQNNFVNYLIKRFGFSKADELVGRYRIGSCSHWPGATVFWQLDKQGLVRTGKVMLYHAQTGKRVKQPFSHITWAHTLLTQNVTVEMQQACANFGYHITQSNYQPQTASFNLQQCLFGEHLLNHAPANGIIAITESEKTAIIASALLPEFTWLAAGSLHNLQYQKCRVLQGRTVILFPDLNAHAKWQTKACQLSRLMPGTVFKVYKHLEDVATATERASGLDLGDVLG